jgi:hypothetical protein
MKSRFKHQYRSIYTTDQDLAKELEILERRAEIETRLQTEADEKFPEVNEEWWNYIWSSPELQQVIREYEQVVPFDEHVSAMLEKYWDTEITVWKEADKLFEKDNDKWQEYVDQSPAMKKARFELAANVPSKLHRSYKDFDPFE